MAVKGEFSSYDSWDTINNSRTPKRQRREFEEKVQERLQEIQNSSEQQQQGEREGEGEGEAQSMRCPRATYPDNFKSSRSRSRTVSDVSVGSHYLVPFEGAPSLPCTPRASMSTSATASATATAEASPCPTGMFREALRFVSIATPSPASTPRSASRSCSRSAGPVSGSGGSSGGGARPYAGRKQIQIQPQHHTYFSQAHAQQLAMALEVASSSIGAGNNCADTGWAVRALDNVLEEDEQLETAESQDSSQKVGHSCSSSGHGTQGEEEAEGEGEFAGSNREDPQDAEEAELAQMVCVRQELKEKEEGEVQPRTAADGVLRALGAVVQGVQRVQAATAEEEDEELLFALEM